ncbi:hypothetical protein [Alloalcanivorax venustensis]|jgi:hypothetical protein|uniref:hypothetical protein n=1 Tax=Alloalcanivorax venustensis TaxID=172371 RepID=UPI0039E4C432
MHIDEETRTAIHHYLGRGITDRLFVVMPVNEDVESYFMFDRLRGQPDFTPQDLEIASYALRSLGWLNRQIHLSYGQLMADAPLTPPSAACSSICWPAAPRKTSPRPWARARTPPTST